MHGPSLSEGVGLPSLGSFVKVNQLSCDVQFISKSGGILDTSHDNNLDLVIQSTEVRGRIPEGHRSNENDIGLLPFEQQMTLEPCSTYELI